MHTNDVALITSPLPINALGRAKRRSPIGGCAFGMPKYSLTSGAWLDACPVRMPLVVFTLVLLVTFFPNTSAGSSMRVIHAGIKRRSLQDHFRIFVESIERIQWMSSRGNGGDKLHPVDSSTSSYLYSQNPSISLERRTRHRSSTPSLFQTERTAELKCLYVIDG